MFTDHWEIANCADAEIWPLMTGNTADDPAETGRQVDIILDGIPIGGRALEVGCGVGRLLKGMLASKAFSAPSLHGVDSSMSMVAASREYLLGCNVPVDLSDGLGLPYPDKYFDFVYSFTVFQHFISLAIIHRNLREIQRVLIPGGLCRIQTINSNGDDPHDLKTYDGRVFRSGKEFAQQFRDVGLKVLDIRDGLTHPKHIWVTARKP